MNMDLLSCSITGPKATPFEAKEVGKRSELFFESFGLGQDLR